MSDVKSRRMPVVFFGHGSPGNVMEENRINKAMGELGKKVF